MCQTITTNIWSQRMEFPYYKYHSYWFHSEAHPNQNQCKNGVSNPEPSNPAPTVQAVGPPTSLNEYELCIVESFHYMYLPTFKASHTLQITTYETVVLYIYVPIYLLQFSFHYVKLCGSRLINIYM